MGNAIPLFVGFPNVIGVVDGCLIDIKKPKDNAHEYILLVLNTSYQLYGK